jgi:uncharacterized protein YndB with AHSA1/START domain
MQLNQAPIAKAEMLIRRPVTEVYRAFIDPAITTKFWFTKSSGRLEAGQRVVWEWEMYGASAEVDVKSLEPNKRILIEWSDPPTSVEWTFTPHGPDATFVSISNSGFSGDGDAVVNEAIGSTEGFTLVLAGLKALLEHNIALNLVGDRFPREPGDA